MANGVYALRVTTGVLSSEGMMACFPEFDSPALFTRDLRSLKSFVHMWCNDELDSIFNPPTSIIVPTDYRVRNGKQKRLIGDFIKNTADCFGVPIRYVNLQNMWIDAPPSEAGNLSLKQYLAGVGRNSFFYEFYQTTQDFRDQWRVERRTPRPKVNMVTGWRWGEAETISSDQHLDAVRHLKVYKKWLQTRLFDEEENPIMILPIQNAEACYRDDPPKTRYPLQEAWDQLWLAPILGAPEITIPIGQVSYPSRISKQKEWLPVVASLLGKPRTDLSLIDTAVKALEYANTPTRVETGRLMWEPGWEYLELTHDLP